MMQSDYDQLFLSLCEKTNNVNDIKKIINFVDLKKYGEKGFRQACKNNMCFDVIKYLIEIDETRPRYNFDIAFKYNNNPLKYNLMDKSQGCRVCISFSI